MFGQMNVLPIVNLQDAPKEVGCSLERAVGKLLEVANLRVTTKWVQFQKALLVFLMVPGDPESGAFYIYDRRLRIWFWVDFEDEKFGGYNTADFEHLVRECRFLDIVESPQLLRSKDQWIIQAGSRPRIDTPSVEVAPPPSPSKIRVDPDKNSPSSII